MSNARGRAPKGDLPLNDWIVPVHDVRRPIRPISLLQLKRARSAAQPSLTAMLEQARQRKELKPNGSIAALERTVLSLHHRKYLERSRCLDRRKRLS
jgi:hypothetical protein